MNKKTSMLATIVPVMLCFFAMGFVDLVGVASNYVKDDLNLTDTVANLLPSMVFVWFLILSVPTGLLMNKIGRKNTVLLSLAVTVVALVLPLLGKDNFAVMMAAFALLGIGNTLMQTSLNPLIADVIKGGNLASTLNFGQFVKAIASFLAPIIATWGASHVVPMLGMEHDWRFLFAVYLIVGVIATAWLAVTPVEETPASGEATSIVQCFKLLGTPIVLFSFIGIICHVGIDVGVNTTAAKVLMERLGMTLDQAAYAGSLYFLFRTIGSLTGGAFMRIVKVKAFFIFSLILMVLSMILLAVGDSKIVLYTAIALVGYGNSNVFSVVFSQALLAMPSKQNEVSGLMIMGICGGMIFPPLMGVASDAIGQVGAVAVMSVGVLYLLYYIKHVNQ